MPAGRQRILPESPCGGMNLYSNAGDSVGRFDRCDLNRPVAVPDNVRLYLDSGWIGRYSGRLTLGSVARQGSMTAGMAREMRIRACL
jgi:hypothetical protein